MLENNYIFFVDHGPDLVDHATGKRAADEVETEAKKGVETGANLEITRPNRREMTGISPSERGSHDGVHRMTWSSFRECQ